MPREREAARSAVHAPAGPLRGAVQAFTETILRRGQGAEAILIAAEAEPEPRVLACAAAYHLLSDTRAGLARAAALLDRAEAASPDRGGATFIAALQAIARDEPESADLAFLTLAREAPDDLLAGYIGHLHFLNHGRPDLMLAQARRLVAGNPDNPFALGMLSLALHETGAWDAASDAALDAEALDPGIAWVHHARGHIFLSRGQGELGAKWLERRAPFWSGCGSSMFTHNWWHAQLLLLQAGDLQRALALYDRHIAGEAGRSVASFVNAASLLARVERRGGEVGDRWRPLAEEARRHLGEHVLPFIDLHYALALARDGDTRACAALKESAQRHAARTRSGLRDAWMLAALPLFDAIVSGDKSLAGEAFARALPHLQRLGGSHQQRDLFRELALHAGET